MIRTVHLSFDDTPEVTRELSAHPGMPGVLEQTAAQAADGMRTVDVTPLILTEPGESPRHDDAIAAFLSRFDSVVIFEPSEADWDVSAHGQLDLGCVRWLKTVAERTATRLALRYELEAGDFVYSRAGWEFSYRAGDVCTEKLWKQEDDPSEAGGYRAVSRTADGRNNREERGRP